MQKNRQVIWCSDSPGWGGSEISMMRVLNFLQPEHARFSALINPAADTHLKEYLTGCHIPADLFYAPSNIKGLVKGMRKAFALRLKQPGAVFVFWSHHIDSCRWLKLWLVLLGARIIIVERSVPDSKAGFANSRLSLPIKKMVNALAQNVVLNASSIVKYYTAIYGKAALTVIPNSRDVAGLQQKVEASRRQTDDRDHYAKPGAINLLLVARLTYPKGIQTAIEALGILRQKGLPLIHLHVVGEGEYRAELEQMAQTRAPGSVHFHGYHADIAPWLAHADIFVFPSQVEGMPGALLEAMAAGLPCVASDIPPNLELVTDNETGFVFKTGDAFALASRLQYVMEHPAEAKRVAGAGALLAATSFDSKQEKERWINFFNTHCV